MSTTPSPSPAACPDAEAAAAQAPRRSRGGAVAAYAITLTLLVYVGLGYALGAFYPFAEFPMYSHKGETDSRVVLELPDGRVVDVKRFEAFDCPDPLPFAAPPGADHDPACESPPRDTSDESRIQAFVRARQQPGLDGQSVALVRVVFRFEDVWGDVQRVRCPLATCTVPLDTGPAEATP